MNFHGLNLRKGVRSGEAILDGRTLNGYMPCLLLHKVNVCKPISIVDSENGWTRNIKVTTRHDVDKLIDQLLRVKAPALDLAPRGEHCL
jgi:hypothetical protein